jgi:hypothetical protein
VAKQRNDKELASYWFNVSMLGIIVWILASFFFVILKHP